MKKENGIARITLIIIVVIIIVIGAFILLRNNSKFEKVENEVAGTLNTQLENIGEGIVNTTTETIDISEKLNNLNSAKTDAIPKAKVRVQK